MVVQLAEACGSVLIHPETHAGLKSIHEHTAVLRVAMHPRNNLAAFCHVTFITLDLTCYARDSITGAGLIRYCSPVV